MKKGRLWILNQTDRGARLWVSCVIKGSPQKNGAQRGKLAEFIKCSAGIKPCNSAFVL